VKPRTAPALFVIAVAAALAGCSFNPKPGAQSIFEAFQETYTPIELVEMATNPYDANSRYLGTLGLAGMPFAAEPIYVKLFEENAKDADASVRVAATRGLAMHGDPSHAPILIAALADKDRLVRIEAARGLQRLHNDAAIDPLIAAMREPDPRKPRNTAEADPEVRAQAAAALGQYPERRVLQALIAAIDDADLSVNRMALSSLRTLTGQDLGLDRPTWLAWVEKAPDPFAGRSTYYYPAFQRNTRWFEQLPFVPRPPNERPAPPTGMPLG
jgi:hypothetical protein